MSLAVELSSKCCGLQEHVLEIDWSSSLGLVPSPDRATLCRVQLLSKLNTMLLSLKDLGYSWASHLSDSGETKEEKKVGRPKDPIRLCCKKRGPGLLGEGWFEYQPGKDKDKAKGDKCFKCGNTWAEAFVYMTWTEFCDFSHSEAVGQVTSAYHTPSLSRSVS
eukprot:6487855-Amphidinium_carterae.4